MSEKKLLNEELAEIVGGADMNAAHLQSVCATLSDAQLYSLLSSLSETRLQQLIGSISDQALESRITGILKNQIGIVIKPTR